MNFAWLPYCQTFILFENADKNYKIKILFCDKIRYNFLIFLSIFHLPYIVQILSHFSLFVVS